jgi:hypothetical protein
MSPVAFDCASADSGAGEPALPVPPPEAELLEVEPLEAPPEAPEAADPELWLEEPHPLAITDVATSAAAQML